MDSKNEASSRLKFISAKSGEHEFRYVLILNPHSVIKELAAQKKIPRQEVYNSLERRDIEVGGKDFLEQKE